MTEQTTTPAPSVTLRANWAQQAETLRERAKAEQATADQQRAVWQKHATDLTELTEAEQSLLNKLGEIRIQLDEVRSQMDETRPLVEDARQRHTAADLAARTMLADAEVIEEVMRRWQAAQPSTPLPPAEALAAALRQGGADFPARPPLDAETARWGQDGASEPAPLRVRPGAVWDPTIPPGGVICAVPTAAPHGGRVMTVAGHGTWRLCAEPIESEPCPEHGTEPPEGSLPTAVEAEPAPLDRPVAGPAAGQSDPLATRPEGVKPPPPGGFPAAEPVVDRPRPEGPQDGGVTAPEQTGDER